MRHELRQIESRILQTSERIVLGETFVDESTGLENQLGPVEDEVARRIMLDDGCHAAADREECLAAGGGVLQWGARNAAVSVVRVVRDIRLSSPLPDVEAGNSLTMLS